MIRPTLSPDQNALRHQWRVAALFALGVLAVGMVPGVLTFALDPSAAGRIGLDEVPVPGWVFTAAFTANYAGMGVATWLVWRRRREADVSVPLAVFAAAFLQTLSFWLTESLRMTFVMDLTGLILAYTVAWVYSRYESAAVWWLLPWLIWMPFTTALKIWALTL